MASLSMRSVCKSYGNGAQIIKSLNLQVEHGEFLVLVGPSGCGKSTLLRMIAGLEDISSGVLEIEGKEANHIPPAKRGIAMVFQSYALYPHMTVYDNMAFALKMAGKGAGAIDLAVRKAAAVLDIEKLLDRKPAALSGGQRQRVAIGRAIVRDPKVFLFDEPLSNLDAALRVQMRMELARLHKELGSTMIYVTHDQVEAMTLGDRIAVFNEGRMEQIGSPEELYEKPCNTFVAGFLGSPKINLLKCAGVQQSGDFREVLLEGGQKLKIPAHSLPAGLTNPSLVGVRPEHWRIGDGQEGIHTKVDLVEHLGDAALLHTVTPKGVRITAKLASDVPRPKAGGRISLTCQPEKMLWFDSSGKSSAAH